jgi:hypothetical protein
VGSSYQTFAFPWRTITGWCWPGVLKLHCSEVSGFRGAGTAKFLKTITLSGGWVDKFMDNYAIMPSLKGTGAGRPPVPFLRSVLDYSGLVCCMIPSQGDMIGRTELMLNLLSPNMKNLDPQRRVRTFQSGIDIVLSIN